MSETANSYAELVDELEALRRRLMELEEMEVMRVTEEQERFDSLQVLDEYAKQLEESRDKLARLLRAGTDVQAARTVKEALQKIATAVGQAGWGSVSVVLLDNFEVAKSAYYGCSQADIEFLETHRRPPDERARFFGPDFERFKISRSYFVAADHLEEVLKPDQVVPGRRTIQPGDTWDPMDLAYVPLYGSDGTVIGSINCDDPTDGRRPNAETFFYLELFADLAARKVEMAQLTEQQHRTEQALRQSERKYRTVFSRSDDGFFLLDPLFRDCNSKACDIWGCSPEDIIGHSPAEFSPEFQADGRTSETAATEYISKAMNGEPQKFNWVHKRLDGRLIDCEVSLSPVEVNDELMVHAIVRDISERIQAERERETLIRLLQTANEYDDQDQMIAHMFEEIGKLMPVENCFVALYDHESDAISFPHFVDEKDENPGSIPLGHGLTSWLIRSRTPLRLSASDFEHIADQVNVQMRGTPAASWLGVPLVSHSAVIGAIVLQSYRTEGLYTERHEQILVALGAQIASILARRIFEDTLRLTQFSVDNGADSSFWIGKDAKVLYANKVASRALEHSNADLLNLHVWDFDPSITPESWSSHWDNVAKKGTVTVESLHQTRGGRCFPVELTISYVQFGGKEIHCTFAKDITERRRTQETQRALHNISDAAGQAENLDQLLGMIRSELGSLVNTANFYVALYEPATDSYTFPYYVDEVDPLPDAPLNLRSSLTDLVRRNGKALLVDKETRNLLPQPGQEAETGTPSRQWLGVPLKTARGTIGVVAVQSYQKSDLYGQKDLDLLESVSGSIAMAIERKRSDDLRRESERQLMALIQNIDDAICLFDPDGKVIFANKAASDLFGRSPEELQACGMGDLIPSHHECARTQCARVEAESERCQCDFTVRGAAGERVVHARRTALLDEAQAIRNIIYVFHDREHERKAELELRSSEERYRNIVQHAPDAILLHQNGQILFANPTAVALFGLEANESLLGRSVYDFVHPTFQETVAQRLEALESGQGVPISEQKLIRPDGTIIDIEIAASPVTYHGEPAVQVIIRDISNRTRTT